MSDKDFTDFLNDAQGVTGAPGYDNPFTGMSPHTKKSAKPQAVAFKAEVYTIHRPRESCRTCYKQSQEQNDADDSEEEAGGEPVVPGPCPHNERTEYIRQINDIHENGHKLISRRIDTLKSGAIQVLVEWIEFKKKEGV